MCLQAGMDDYVSKPFSQETLLEKVNKFATAAESVKAPPKSTAEQPAAEGPKTPLSQKTPTTPLSAHKIVEPPFRPAAALATLGGDIDLLSAVAVQFSESAAEEISAIGEAIDLRDRDALGSSLHLLKGSLSPLSATAATRLATELAHLAGDGNWEDIEAVAAELRKEVFRLADTLRATFMRPRSSGVRMSLHQTPTSVVAAPCTPQAPTSVDSIRLPAPPSELSTFALNTPVLIVCGNDQLAAALFAIAREAGRDALVAHSSLEALTRVTQLAFSYIVLVPSTLFDSNPIDLAAGLAYDHKHVHNTPTHIVVLAGPETDCAFTARLRRCVVSRSKGGGPTTTVQVVDEPDLLSVLRVQPQPDTMESEL